MAGQVFDPKKMKPEHPERESGRALKKSVAPQNVNFHT
jgi:hypothetical protein